MELEFDRPAIKHDRDKVKWGLMPFEALEEVAKVMTYGAAKYSTNNWRGGMGYLRLVSAALRHIVAWVGGQDEDEETGVSPLAHACCCLLFLITYEKTKTGRDDRFTYHPGPSEPPPR